MRGFTLIELLVVLAIAALLTSIALPRYVQYVDRQKEAVLAENLRQTRHAIEQFHADRGRYPASLEELVALRYLRNRPMDPLLESDRQWQLLPPPMSEQASALGDIRSAAPGIGRNGIPFQQW